MTMLHLAAGPCGAHAYRRAHGAAVGFTGAPNVALADAIGAGFLYVCAFMEQETSRAATAAAPAD